jgi:hypothetical protein
MPIRGIEINHTDTWIQGSGLFSETNGITQKLESFLPLSISLMAVGLLCLVNIFNFRNRSIQKKFIWVAMALIVGLSFWIAHYADRLPEGDAKPYFAVGTFLPVLALIFCSLASRGIHKDELLLKSADRLR